MPGLIRGADAGNFLPDVSPDGLAESATATSAPDAAHQDFIFGGTAAADSSADVQEHPALSGADVNVEGPEAAHDDVPGASHGTDVKVEGPEADHDGAPYAPDDTNATGGEAPVSSNSLGASGDAGQNYDNDDAYMQELMKALAQIRKSENLLKQDIGSRPGPQGTALQEGSAQPRDNFGQQSEPSHVNKEYTYEVQNGAEPARPSLQGLSPNHQAVEPTPMSPEDEQMMRAMQVQQAGFHLDWSALKTLKTGLLVTGGMCSKLFGIGLMGYLAFQSMQSNVARQQEQQQQRPEPQMHPRCQGPPSYA